MSTHQTVIRPDRKPSEVRANGSRLGPNRDSELAEREAAPPLVRYGLEKILETGRPGDGTPLISPKLEVSRPSEPLEVEADRIANQVMDRRAPEPYGPDAAGITGTPESDLQVSRSSNLEILQRACEGCTPGEPCTECEEETSGEKVMRKSDRHSEKSTSTSDLVSLVRDLGTGTPIDPVTREFMEDRLGHDFSQVRIHSDANAARSAKAFNALGYTVGRDIVFGAGQYPLGTSESKRLLAHELVHVIQQGNAGKNRVSKLSEARLMRKDDQPEGSTTTRIEGSAGSISWIDPGAPAGQGKLAVADPPPADNTTEAFITGSSGFRFSNYVHGFVETKDNAHVANSGYFPDSDIHTGPSFAGLSSYVYPRKQSSNPVADGGIEGVEFDQTVGARTVSPAKIAAGVGTGVGVLAGIWAGVKIGGITGGIFGEGIGAIPGAIIGGIIGGVAGFFAGSTAGNVIFNFPPIWTRLKLRLMADGRKTCNEVEHSIFPSSTYYCNLSAIDHYSALAPEQAKWGDAGWGAGNPWGAEKPIATP